MSAETALWSRESWESAPDAALLDQAREGSAEAFGELWRRHLPAAHGVAGKYGGRTPPEDIVAEAATKVFTLLQAGRGPDEHFRAYFLTTVRTVAADHTRRELRAVPVADDDLELLVDPAAAADSEAGEAGELGDSDLFDTELVRTAFSGLPERDQQVLWHTTVEGEAPRVVAPRLGMTPGAVSSRAMRARESLRAGYLDAYAERCLAHAESRECTWTIERLGRLVRGRLPRRQTQRAEAHVAACPHAAAVVADLQEIYRGFPALVVPLVLAAGFGTSGLAAALGFAGAGAGAGAAALAAMGEVPAATGGAAGAATGAGAGLGGAVASESSQLATRLAVVLAGGVVTLGLVAAALTSGGSDTPAPPVAAATASAGPTASAGATGTSTATSTLATPPVTATATGALPTPTTGGATATPPTSAATAPTAVNAPSRSASAVAQAARTVSPRPTGTAADPAPAPPTSAPGVPPAAGVTARLLGEGDTTRISLRVPADSTGGPLTVSITTVGGAGSLTVANRTFDCAQSASSSLTCVGEGGQIQLLQSGTGGAAALVVRVRNASGAVTQSVVVPS